MFYQETIFECEPLLFFAVIYMSYVKCEGLIEGWGWFDWVLHLWYYIGYCTTALYTVYVFKKIYCCVAVVLCTTTVDLLRLTGGTRLDCTGNWVHKFFFSTGDWTGLTFTIYQFNSESPVHSAVSWRIYSSLEWRVRVRVLGQNWWKILLHG